MAKASDRCAMQGVTTQYKSTPRDSLLENASDNMKSWLHHGNMAAPAGQGAGRIFPYL